MHTRLLSTILTAGLALAGNALAQPADPAPAAPRAEQPPADGPNVSIPTAQEIVARYIKAIGGEDALRKHTSRTDKGTMNMGAISGSMTVYSAAPNKRVGIFATEQMGTINQGYNGEKGWEMGPQGNRLLEGDALADRARTSDFYQQLNLLTNHEVRVVGAESFGGKPAYRLGLKHKDNKAGPEQFMIFDAASGLLVGRITERQTAAGPVKLETTIADYKEFGGILTPTRVTTLAMGQEQVMTIESVEFDNVPDSAFDVPRELAEGGK
ncbi:MAG: hypothetical protein IT436_07905 [Phycisphaerales bacterium]|nr:hypothetical protein [Phycisphaerales bacterium]